MTIQSYNNDDLVYVDPESRTVIGPVKFNANGLPESLPFTKKETKEAWRKFYPWGTYRSMKGAFRIEGKRQSEEGADSMDEVMSLFLSDSL